MITRAKVFGAVSIVNAISTGRGATLGIDSTVEATVEAVEGNGIQIESDNHSMSSRLVNRVVEKTIPKRELSQNKIIISLKSQIPTGYGLKSSSAISSAISLACHRLFRKKYTDRHVLLAGVDASIETKVSITGAFDDACACYYGGFVVTDNYKRKIVRMERAPAGLEAVVFVPNIRKRGNVKHLRTLGPVFERAWKLASEGQYWNAMVLNGIAGSTILNSDPKIISRAIEAGAIGASVSGNGPAIAAVARSDAVSRIKKVFADLDGRVFTANINNKRAEVHAL
jgi:shikimate kinase